MKQHLDHPSYKKALSVGLLLGVALLATLALGACGTAAASGANTPTPQATSTPAAQSLGTGDHLARVVSINGNTLTVTLGADNKGQQKTLTVSSATKITTYGQSASLSDIQANQWLMVRGTDTQHIQQINILGSGAMGTIQALSAGGFTLLYSKHAGTGTATISVGSSTHIQEGQVQIGLSDLQTGESVAAFGNQNSAGSLNALLIRVNLVSGQVTAINGSSITLNHGAKGTEVSVTTSASTQYYLAGQPVAASQLQMGDTVGVAGPVSNKTSVAATAIFIGAQHVTGKVQGVSGSTITLETKGGVTWTVTVSSSTKYLKGGQPASPTDVQPGSTIEAAGIKSGDNALTAVVVRVHA